MPPDSAAGFRSRFSVERMLRIHERLRDGDAVNCTQLAREMEVSRKTIQRDIDHMRDRLGLPLEYDRAAHSYAYTAPVEAFPTVQMSEGDAVALFVAERALEPLRGTPLFDRLRATFDKLTANLKGTVDITADDHDAVSFRHFGEGRTNAAAFDALQKARDQHREVTFNYRKPGAESATEERRVRPYHLTHRDNLWYLVAYDCARAALRTFALPRMSEVNLTRTRFELPADFDPSAFFSSALGVVEGKGDFAIHIRFAATVAHRIEERDWHESQRLERRRDGSVDLHLRLSSLVEIERWVLGWGDQAEVLAPTELRNQLAQTTAAMAARYN
ncbi:helix-turn-helix transcriptional regulator [Actomonas aquatica]|uniref:Transcriptional regulator n=1 Tax=Actomonas aquatica TaxID=2866162 RepID=A0ABZ1C9P5_9BACT|nr:transcriptional regulator [Opitutus sp. WL0086]WRQ88406.1 transcriptional regulator [Opitutus sp. WL0086]